MKRLANLRDNELRKLAMLFFVLLSGGGCGVKGPGLDGGQAGGTAAEGPFGPPDRSALLAPLTGSWVRDVEKTLEAQKAAGAGEEQVAALREFYARSAEFGGMLSEMTITGNEAVGKDGSEYRFFAMHQHDGKICGKAWHHEDRYDPGDMSKCYARMKLDGKVLYLEVKMKDGLPDLNDPDLGPSSLPAEGGSAATCDADTPAGSDWGEWTTTVFARKQ